ncbi:hypothetical protein DXK94_02540 [Arthrobacter sp. RT-1]|nr:hypothetical protein DXK94_02540 [Arthrobacter sp. RT-1]
MSFIHSEPDLVVNLFRATAVKPTAHLVVPVFDLLAVGAVHIDVECVVVAIVQPCVATAILFIALLLDVDDLSSVIAFHADREVHPIAAGIGRFQRLDVAAVSVVAVAVVMGCGRGGHSRGTREQTE